MLAVGTLRQLTKSADPIPSTDTGWQLPDNGRLPAGEIAFIQTFRGRFGNPIECLVSLGQDCS